MAEFRMPSLGADMVEGTVLHWFVRPGQRVHTGDIVAEIDTTKAAIEVESFDDGVLTEILVTEGATVAVGTPLATIATTAEPAPDTSPPAHGDAEPAPTDGFGTAPLPPTAAQGPTAHPAAPPRSDGSERDHRATPLIRKLAAEAGIDIAAVPGSGPGGRVMRADIERAKTGASSHPPSPPNGGPGPAPTDRATAPTRATGVSVAKPYTGPASGYARRVAHASGVELAGVTGSGPDGAVRARDLPTGGRAPEPVTGQPQIPSAIADDAGKTAQNPPHDPTAARQLIAAAMTRSKRTVPHYICRASSIWRRPPARCAASTNKHRYPNESWSRRCCCALWPGQRAPFPNSTDSGATTDSSRRRMSIWARWCRCAGGGILVPTIPDADRLSPTQMMQAMRGLVARTRSSRLRSRDTTQATITVTNLGDLGADAVFGVIPVPQVAIIGFGAVTERPCAVAGLVGVRPQVTATLSADHRASDGAVGARFLHCITDYLQHPEEL